MLVAFRVDASIEIGTGHVIRCLTLAKELRNQGHVCKFICRAHDGNLGGLIEKEGFELSLLPLVDSRVESDLRSKLEHANWLGISQQKDAEDTIKALNDLRIDWLVVDHYALDAEWERQFRNISQKILVIDDLADRNHDCDVLLDQNLGRAESDYDNRLPKSCKLLVGPQYALLRPEFAKLRVESIARRPVTKIKRILISFGGVDNLNATCAVINVLKRLDLGSEVELDIIMGAYAPNLAQVIQAVKSTPFKTQVSINISDMAERMLEADIAIGAAGGSAWERCCMGLPSIQLIIAENQIAGAKALSESNAAVLIEDIAHLDEELPKHLSRLSIQQEYTTLVNNAASITQGNGAGLVIKILSHILSSKR